MGTSLLQCQQTKSPKPTVHALQNPVLLRTHEVCQTNKSNQHNSQHPKDLLPWSWWPNGKESLNEQYCLLHLFYNLYVNVYGWGFSKINLVTHYFRHHNARPFIYTSEIFVLFLLKVNTVLEKWKNGHRCLQILF